MRPTNVLAALMMKGPLNSMALIAATHREFGKVADGTSTRVRTCMTNRSRPKIDWKKIYNVRDPPRMRDQESGGRKKENTGEICMILEAFGT